MKTEKLTITILFFILIFLLFNIFTKPKTEIINTPVAEEEIVETENVETTDSNYLDSYNDLKDYIKTSCSNIKIDDINHQETGRGFFWLKDDNSPLYLEGNSFYINYDEDGKDKECFDLLKIYFDKNFISNDLNSQKDSTTAYEKDEIKCILDTNALDCGIYTENEKSSLHQELYPFINPKNDLNTLFNISKTEGDFAIIGIGARLGGGYMSIWKKEDTKWSELFGTQDAWDCQKVLENEVPASLIDNSCFDYEKQEKLVYDKELEKWQKE